MLRGGKEGLRERWQSSSYCGEKENMLIFEALKVAKWHSDGNYFTGLSLSSSPSFFLGVSSDVRGL
jgi:hypothetical protein